MHKAIITSASNKFFPSLINMLGSLNVNYPNHPPIFIYNLGLSFMFRQELRQIEGVILLDIPHFVPHWRVCYTWKTYIFVNPLAELNLYLDAGTQILRPLNEMFDVIDKDGYFAVHQGVKNKEIIPSDYTEKFDVQNSTLEDYSITAGIFGFKKNGSVSHQLEDMHEASKEGYCLGFSQEEIWKNKGVNKTEFIRDCPKFRHDTTLLSIFLRKDNLDFRAHEALMYAGWMSPHDHKNQAIWNVRMNYKTLDFLTPHILHKNFSFISYINRIYIYAFLLVRQLRSAFK